MTESSIPSAEEGDLTFLVIMEDPEQHTEENDYLCRIDGCICYVAAGLATPDEAVRLSQAS